MASGPSSRLSVFDRWFKKNKRSVAVSTEHKLEHQVEDNNKGKASVIPQQCGLLNLPIDIVHCITDFLEYEDEACLLLCSKVFGRVLGLKAWQSIRIGAGSDEHRKKFLLCYARDHVGYFLCNECLRLHVEDRVGLLAHLKYQQPIHQNFRCLQDKANFQNCVRETFKVHHNRSEIISLTFEMVHLAMMRHRNGPEYGIPLNKLSLTEVRHSKGCGKTLLSVMPKIIDGELHLHIQSLLISNLSDIRDAIRTRIINICQHIRRGDYDLTRIFECKLSHLDHASDCSLCGNVLECQVCDLRFKVGFRNIGSVDMRSMDMVFFVAKTLNLGDGIDPLDPKWLRHQTVPKDHLAQFCLEWSEWTDPRQRSMIERQIWEKSRILQRESYKRDFTQIQWQRWKSTTPTHYHDIWIHQPRFKIDTFWEADSKPSREIPRRKRDWLARIWTNKGE